MGPQLIAFAASAQWLLSLKLYRDLAPAGEIVGSPVAAGGVSVIIPARNEAQHLPRLLSSLPREGPLEVIVVDDDSTDGTGEIAARHGAKVIRLTGPPAGWIGKTWACFQGAAVARGEILLFLDADCWFEPGGYAGLMQRYPGGAFSVVPWHRIERPYEELSAFFNLIMVVANIRRDLFGQCLLVGRDAYSAVGGHESVRDCILENVELGRRLRQQGSGVGSIPGRGILAMRMYPDGLAALIAGWSKGFAQGAGSVPPGRMLLISGWIGGMIAVVAGCFMTPWMLPLYLAYAILLAAMLRRIGSFSVLGALLYPIGLLFYHIVFFRALAGAGKKATWKGRSVDVA